MKRRTKKTKKEEVDQVEDRRDAVNAVVAVEAEAGIDVEEGVGVALEVEVAHDDAGGIARGRALGSVPHSSGLLQMQNPAFQQHQSSSS